MKRETAEYALPFFRRRQGLRLTPDSSAIKPYSVTKNKKFLPKMLDTPISLCYSEECYIMARYAYLSQKTGWIML